ncbi:aldose 1-epimerase [Nonomuraea angiospora]|uniref:Aldose 1-epimerase n=1 Tax=Nonomuraea angiospora TaxID=46172 RepID=A0ABR9M5N7_9ACTN|nr:aldose 1-epimerase [Nonomuraea angiospora]
MSEVFGTLPSGRLVHRYTLQSTTGLRARILTYGGVLQTLEVPGGDGQEANVVLGYPDLDGYLNGDAYFGAVIGRFANRIAGGRFTLDGREYRLPVNSGTTSIHGGRKGFDRRLWVAATATADSLTLTRTSPDGEEGYPGDLRAWITYVLNGNSLTITYEATTDAPTIINLTNHSYFNLSGEGTGPVNDHLLRIDADHYLPTDADLIPTGAPAPVAGTILDLRTLRPIGPPFSDPGLGEGYNHSYLLTGSIALRDPASGRSMEVTTTEPTVHLYSAYLLDGTVRGTSGRPYPCGAGVCLETQRHLDAPNQPEFPTTVLRPGETYFSTTTYQFSARRRPDGDRLDGP